MRWAVTAPIALIAGVILAGCASAASSTRVPVFGFSYLGSHGRICDAEDTPLAVFGWRGGVLGVVFPGPSRISGAARALSEQVAAFSRPYPQAR